MAVKPMLTFLEAFRWVQIGFCIAVGLGVARLGGILLAYLWSEISLNREIKAYAEKHGIRYK
jgi:hypothetical protein